MRDVSDGPCCEPTQVINAVAMHNRRPLTFRFQPSCSAILLVALVSVLWIAGGASRADTISQAIVRTASWVVLVIAILIGPRPALDGMKPVLLLLVAALALALMQLVPLPPSFWQALPGHSMLTEAASASGQAQPWRSWSIDPGATWNAASSLVVPLTVLLLLAQLKDAECDWMPGIVLCFIATQMLVGLLQFSGTSLVNPLVNSDAGDVAGMFANRNHFALLMAIGCVLTPVWAFLNGRRPQWRGPVAGGLLLLLVLTILASGSRAGVVFGAIGLLMGLLIIFGDLRRSLRSYPRWVLPTLLGCAVGLIAVAGLLTVLEGRAISIVRIATVDRADDMRSRGLPTVLSMIRSYFPMGSGLGGFDTVFRMNESFALLQPTYFNHAHNDWLEITLDAGVLGILLMLAVLAWWGWASLRVWRSASDKGRTLARAGSAMLMLVMGASAFDYPARTPAVMALIVVFAWWLSHGKRQASATALPR